MTPKGERLARSLREALRRPDAGEALLDRVRAEFEPVTELDAGEHVRVDTTGPPDATVRAAREALLALTSFSPWRGSGRRRPVVLPYPAVAA